MNDGVVQVLMDTACYVTSQTVTPGATADYTLATNVLEIIDLSSTASNVVYGITRVTAGEILEMRRSAAAATSPTLFYALAGHNTVMFHPTPAAADTFTIYYVPVPTALSATGDDPSTASLGGIPTAFHKAIEFYALSEAADANDDQSSQQGAKYFQLYQDQIKKVRRVLKRRGGALAPLARIGPRGRSRWGVRHDNGTYP